MDEAMITQRTPDWFRARLGKFTASEIGNLRGKPRKAGEVFTDTAKAYIYQKLGERLLDPAMVADDERFAEYLRRTTPVSRAMQYGTETEAEAVGLYSLQTGNEVAVGGYCALADAPYITASPDGRIGEDGLLEIKCPEIKTFAQYLVEVRDAAALLEAKPMYYWQVQCQLLCTGRAWCDWCAYSADCGGLAHIVRVGRDEALMAEMLDKARAANAMIEAEVARIRN